ncbi:MAG: PAS domain S-box protein [Desulfobulbaceae bacterium]|nr:MAG: PAS domain S-box protein [Desulfobulbaceae bacterium]
MLQDTHQNMEKKLLEYEKLYQAFFMENRSPIAVIDTSGRYLDANPAFLHFVEETKESLLQKSILNFQPPEKISEEKVHRLAWQEGATSLKTEYYINGRIKVLELTITPIIYKGVQAVAGTGVDVTERNRVEEKLARSEAMYRSAYTLLRSLCDNVPDMIWAKDLKNNYMFTNVAVCRDLLNAVHTSEPIDKSDLFFAERERASCPDQPQWHTFGELCRDSDEVTKEAGVPLQFDEFGNVKGKFLFLDVHKAPFFDENGTMIGTVGSARDVTEQKKMERQLKEREQRLDLAIRGADLGTWDWHIPSGAIIINQRWAEMLGYSAEEVAPHIGSWIAMVHSDDIGRVRAALDLHLAGETDRYESEYRIRHKSGEWVWVLDKGRVIEWDADGSPIRACGTHLDITRQKILIEQSRDGIVILDSQGKIREANQRFAEMLGYTPEELRNLHVWDWDTQWTREQLLQAIVLIDSSGDFFETTHRRKDGAVYPVEISTNGSTCGGEKLVFCVCRDISERKRMEEERNRLQSQLIHAQKIEAIGTLAGGIAHDFNNILGAVIGYAEMAMEGIPPHSVIAKDIGRVLEAGNRAASLVKQILAFSRQQESERLLLTPATIVKEVVRLLRPSLPSTIAINHHIVSKRKVFADPTQLHQVLMNLATNAFHAMEQTGGRLEITVSDVEYSEVDISVGRNVVPGQFVLISVADTGNGIPPEIRERIFDPYFTTKEVGKGTGMGLSIVDGVIRSYGGCITFESEPGMGTTFTVALPAFEAEAADQGKEKGAAPAGAGRILLIDDEELLVELSKTMLERLGYEVAVQTNSLEALNTFENDPHHFDAVVTDQTMPGMTGLDLARRMLMIRPDLPVILCTGYSSLVNEAKAKAYGIKGFVLKPFTKKTIAALLTEVMAASQKNEECG